ncbi:hypothetical protein Bbelb_055070 [Branchiostoma belcheri]|nr:hypothetical protein Bbelb_055070 [Branchiostoma belcheri]
MGCCAGWTTCLEPSSGKGPSSLLPVQTCPTTPTRPPYTGYPELQPPVRWVEETSGPPRTRWKDVLAKDLALVNITPEEAQGAAQDRPRWRELVRLFRRRFHTVTTLYKLLNGHCPPHLQTLIPRTRASATESR